MKDVGVSVSVPEGGRGGRGSCLKKGRIFEQSATDCCFHDKFWHRSLKKPRNAGFFDDG